MALLACTSVFAQQPPRLNERLLKEAFEDNLKDADSAKFKDLRYKPGDSAGLWHMCGQVNAKNSYGAYSGFDRFTGVVVKEGKQVSYLVMSIGEVADMYCKNKGM